MKGETTLRVADYTDMPIGRNSLDGPKNGLDYLENHVLKALDKYEFVTIDFNGTLGTTPSFLEEVFGGLVRNRYITRDELKRRVKVLYKYQSVLNTIERFINEANDNLNK